MLTFVLQVIIFQILFLLVYDVFLKKETFFTYNRWYLLLSSIISLLLPLVKIDALAIVLPQETFSELSTVWLPEVTLGETSNKFYPGATENANRELKFNWWLIIYLFGFITSFIIFIRKYQKLSRLFRFKIVSTEKNLQIIEIPGSTMACTFYNTIFLGEKISEADREKIISHELVHVKQKHSLDLIYFEVLKIILWFNPLNHLYQNRIATLHEFIADAEAVKVSEKRSYCEQLLNSAFNTSNISFINQFFNHSLIKKRIIMLQKTRSKTIAKAKYLSMFPLMLIMLTYVACSDENSSLRLNDEDSLSQYSYTLNRFEEMSEEKKQIHAKYEEFLTNNPDYVSWATINGDEITYSVHRKKEELPDGYIKLQVSDKYDMYINLPKKGKVEGDNEVSQKYEYKETDDAVPFAVIDQVPIFPGCEDLGSNEDQKKCMTEKIQEIVLKNFNTSLGKALGLTGVNRIIAVFKINENGEVINVRARAPHPGLEEEAKRVISTLPVMIPGKHGGVPKAVSYSLPIVLKVDE